ADEPRLELGERFWAAYEAVKAYQPKHRRTHSENAVETKACNNLNCVVRRFPDELGELLPFARDLIRDIREFHTLAKHTLRQISRHEVSAQSPPARIEDLKKVIENLRRILGDDYLKRAKEEARRYRNTIIIAVENRGTR
ncbi:MAG: hypothetical protein J7M14_05520, partial [Planctomycetes bacterium]|nr:hypothetical protein [Planctomycetota bacterium]